MANVEWSFEAVVIVLPDEELAINVEPTKSIIILKSSFFSLGDKSRDKRR